MAVPDFCVASTVSHQNIGLFLKSVEKVQSWLNSEKDIGHYT